MEEAETRKENNITATPQNNAALTPSKKESKISAIDKERIQRTSERRAKARTSFCLKPHKCDPHDTSENKTVRVAPSFYDENLTDDQKYEIVRATNCAATGSASYEYALLLINQTIKCLHGNEAESIIASTNAVTQALLSLSPQDEIEGMLITRLFVLHDQYMERLRKAKDSEYIHQGDHQINSATKLMRLYNETLEALNRHRRKGEQKVTVQHQHVNVGNGGQAIVAGLVGQGGGDHGKK